MKILILINNLGVGGAERLVIDDIHELLKRGIDVSLLTLKPEPKGRSLMQSLRLPADRVIQFDFGSIFSGLSWIGLIRKLKDVKPDALITHLWYSNTIGRIAGKLAGVKKIITFEHNVYDTLKTRKMFWIDRHLQGFSTYIVAVSASVRDSLVRHGIAANKVKVILNGIDTAPYENGAASRIRNDLDISAKFLFIFIGRLIPAKGVDILIEALGKTSDSHLLIIGAGKEREALERQAEKAGIASRVHFLGIRRDIAGLLIASDCFVLPSRYEGLPMVVLEAIAAKKPIIVSDFESAKELIHDGENGLIVAREDADALAQTMKRIQNDQALRDRLRSGAIRSAASVSISAHADSLLDLLK